MWVLVGRATFPRTPHVWEIIRRLCASQPHGNSTPAGSSGGSVEKYHCPLCLSWPSPVAVRLAVHGQSSLVPKKEVAACLQPWLQTQGMYLMNAYSVVKVLTFRGLYWPITALKGPLVGFF